jgi:Rrf2 family protein
MNDLRTLLKREESYAIHALINIHENPSTNAAKIAQQLQVPPAFLAKVLKKLVNAGYIESHMGRHGGVSLRVDLKDISLLSVIEAMSGEVILDTCQKQNRCATQKRKGHCHLKIAWLGASLEIRRLLESVKLAQLADPPVAA